MIQIEKGIKAPKLEKRGRKSMYPFSDMKEGDSFFVSGVTPGRLASTAYNYAKRHCLEDKYVAKKEGDGARIWRIV